MVASTSSYRTQEVPERSASFNKLRWGLLGLMLAVLTTVTTMVIADILHTRHEQIEDGGRQTRNLVRTLEVHVASTIDLVDLVLDDVEVELERDAFDAMAHAVPLTRMLASRTPGHPEIADLMVIDAKGRVVVDARGEPLIADVASHPMFTHPRANPARPLQITEPFHGNEHNWLLALSRPLHRPGMPFVGVAVAILNLDQFSRFYARFDLGAHGALSLFNLDGVMLARFPDREGRVGTHVKGLETLRRIKLGELAGTVHHTSPTDGIQQVESFRRLEGLPLFVAVGLPDEDLLEHWRQTRDQRLLGLLATWLAIGALTFVVWRQLHRLQTMSNALKASQRRFQAVFDSTFQFIGLLSPAGTVCEANRASLSAPQRLVGLPLWEAPWWGDSAKTRDQVAGAVRAAANGAFVRFEAEVTGADGRLGTTDFSIKALTDDDNHIVLLIAEGRDISERKRAEEALRESEHRLRRMVERLPAGAAYVDGNVLSINHQAEVISGYAREELTTLESWFATLYPEHCETVKRIYFAALSTGFRQPIVAPLIRKDGTKRTVEFAVYGNTDEAVWMLHDITDRLNAEQALRASTSRLTALIKTLPDTVFIFDDDGRYVEIIRSDPSETPNQRAVTAGRLLHDVQPQDVADTLLSAIRRTIDSGLSQSVEFRLPRTSGRSGGACWYEGRTAALAFDFGPRPSVLVSARDITERRQIEDALRESETRYALAVQGTRDVVWDWDIESDQVFFSENWSRLLGYEDGALPAGRAGWEQVVFCADRPRVCAVIDQGRRNDDSLIEAVYRVITKDGTPLWLHAKGQISRRDDTRPYRITGTFTDVTDKKIAEEKMLQAKEIAERANEAKSQFLANMSHELRTPLNAIIGFSEILAREDDLPSQCPTPESQRAIEYASYIHNSGVHLLELINDLLDMSKLESGLYDLSEEEVDLHEVVTTCRMMVQIKAENGKITIAEDVGPDMPMVRAERRALQQVVLNILSNAVKFTPEGGQVTIRLQRTPVDGCALVISDTGIGIDASALARVMEPFQQADMTISRKFGGTGLGLPISHNLVLLHGGTLTLESTLGVGTTVTMVLPPERVINDVDGFGALPDFDLALLGLSPPQMAVGPSRDDRGNGFAA